MNDTSAIRPPRAGPRTLLASLSRRTARKLRRASFRYVYPVAPALHTLLFFKLRQRIILLRGLLRAGGFSAIPRVFLSDAGSGEGPAAPLVSVIVPCYNHAPFLEERLRSIEEQTYPHLEILLLDDGSSDGSPTILASFAERHPDICRLILNERNSGSPFQQWRKGLALAKGDLVWIAESDDFCEPGFLEALVPLFANPALMLAFGRIRFVDEEGRHEVWSMEQYLPELSPLAWSKPFVSSAHQLVQGVWSRRNLIPNASGTLFRPPGDLPLMGDPHWQEMRVCGDWLFYLHIALGGLVAYSPEAVCGYRQHPCNTSVSQHSERRYLEEHLLLSDRLTRLFRLGIAECRVMQAELRRRWRQNHDTPLPTELEERIEALHPHSPAGEERLPNLLMVTYSLIPGGGEILPIRLANILRGMGVPITMLNCHQHPNQPGVRRMLRPDIPLVELCSLEALPTIIDAFGIDIVHSHHPWADTTICELLQGVCDVAHVITSHGMYDELEPDELARAAGLLRPWVRQVTCVAENNWPALRRMGFPQERIHRIPNCIDGQPVNPVQRESLGIPGDAYLVCLVSRAIREKGWQEAIEAIDLARWRTGREVHLLIIGEGPEEHRLRRSGSGEHIHFLGFRSNSRDWFAASDLGILPTFYPGESQPLTLIDCLAAGTPYLASDVGEIRAMLTTAEGMAGFAVPLVDGKVSPHAFADRIVDYLEDPELLRRHRHCATVAARAFDPAAIGNAYLEIYGRALTTSAIPTS